MKVASKRSKFENGEKVLNGRYEILKCIHSTGMANVYIVMDTTLSKQWCLKEIRKDEAGREDIEYKSLLQEANILRKLNNERIPRIVTLEEENDSVFVVMDYLDGMDLKQLVDKQGKIDEDLAVRWMVQITQIIGYLHSTKGKKNPIIYRDMKPDNVIIRSNGNVNLLDFGICEEITEPNQKPVYTLGTKGYVAPEQKKRNLPLDLRSDIYAMGLTFYFMLTGVDPRTCKTIEELKPIDVWSPNVSKVLIDIINKCIQVNPDDRFQSCEELQYALENYKTMDSSYKASAKRKVRISIGLMIAGMLVSISSIIPYTLNKSNQEERYNSALVVAEQSGKFEDYEEVLNLNSIELNPYWGYIESIKSDGKFTQDEEKKLLNHINPNLEEIKKSSDYSKLAYEIGKLYWFYYSDDGKILSIKWFADAKEYNSKESNIYYNLGVFKRDISKSINEASDSGMYKAYWNNLLALQGTKDSDIVTLQINNAIVECISSYVYNLKKEDITYNDIITEIDILNDFVNSYTVDETSVDVVKDLYNKLSSSLLDLRDRVDIVYKKKLGGDTNVVKD